MSKITPLLYTGSETDARNKTFLKSKNIKLIVNTSSELPNYFANEFEYLRLELDDTSTQNLSGLEQSIQKIIQYLKNGKAVFIHSKNGKSRNSLIVVDVLMQLHDWNFDRAFRYLKSIYREADLNPGFIEYLVLKNTEANRQTSTHLHEETPVGSIEYIPQDDLQGSSPQDEEPIHRAPENRFPKSKYKKIDPEPTESDSKNTDNRWSKLTLDCPDCEQPGYTPLRHGMYARIFT